MDTWVELPLVVARTAARRCPKLPFVRRLPIHDGMVDDESVPQGRVPAGCLRRGSPAQGAPQSAQGRVRLSGRRRRRRGITLRENCRAFEDVTFRPRHAVAVAGCDLRTRVLGFDLSLPFLLSPV